MTEQERPATALLQIASAIPVVTQIGLWLCILSSLIMPLLWYVVPPGRITELTVALLYFISFSSMITTVVNPTYAFRSVTAEPSLSPESKRNFGLSYLLIFQPAFFATTFLATS